MGTIVKNEYHFNKYFESLKIVDKMVREITVDSRNSKKSLQKMNMKPIKIIYEHVKVKVKTFSISEK